MLHSYTELRQFSAILRGQPIRFISKPGIPSWDQIAPSATLLAEKVEMPPEARSLLLGCGHGALAVSLSQQVPRGELWLADTSFIALLLAKQTLRINQVSNAHLYEGISLLPEASQTFDVVLIDLPKGRKLAQRWLVQAWNLLRSAGILYLAGANSQGIQSIIRDAQGLFGSATILGYKKGNRIARLIKPDHDHRGPDWASQPGIAPGTWLEIEVETPSGPIQLHSLPGIFSSEGLDEGTQLLLFCLKAPHGAEVLDLGCGYGLIGLMAAQSGASHVDLVDSNLLAVAAARENLTLHGISNASVFPSDALGAVLERRYDLVVTNPPFHVGARVDYQVTQAFIQQTREVLSPGGSLLLVANRFIPYGRILEKTFSRVDRLAETGRYYVFQAWK